MLSPFIKVLLRAEYQGQYTVHAGPDGCRRFPIDQGSTMGQDIEARSRQPLRESAVSAFGLNSVQLPRHRYRNGAYNLPGRGNRINWWELLFRGFADFYAEIRVFPELQLIPPPKQLLLQFFRQRRYSSSIKKSLNDVDQFPYHVNPRLFQINFNTSG